MTSARVAGDPTAVPTSTLASQIQMSRVGSLPVSACAPAPVRGMGAASIFGRVHMTGDICIAIFRLATSLRVSPLCAACPMQSKAVCIPASSHATDM